MDPTKTKPIYLLADSELLFWKPGDRPFSSRIHEEMEPDRSQAAYIGAANRDDPQFYDLFCAAMEMIGLTQCRMIPSQPSPEDRGFVEEAGLLLLAGGDVERGWRILEQNGLKDVILRRRYDGLVIVGVSAGAVQLGLGALSDSPQPQKINLLSFAPFYVGAHEEHDDWWNLRALVNLSQTDVRGIGIPAGAGAVYHPEGTLEPVRKPLVELSKQNGQVVENLLLPGAPTPLKNEPAT